MSSLQTLADEARQFCRSAQQRTFNTLDGACHENVIGAADYIRLHTERIPTLVWGVVSTKPPSETADTFYNADRTRTHFWVELVDSPTGIVDPYTNTPLGVGDMPELTEGVAYGGPQPDCYNAVEQFHYYGSLAPKDLASKDNFSSALATKPVKRYQK